MSKNVQWIETVRQARDYEGRWSGLLLPAAGSHKVELRRSYQDAPGYFAQMLITVYSSKENPEIVMSMNGKVAMSANELKQMHGAVLEARIKLESITHAYLEPDLGEDS